MRVVLLLAVLAIGIAACPSPPAPPPGPPVDTVTPPPPPPVDTVAPVLQIRNEGMVGPGTTKTLTVRLTRLEGGMPMPNRRLIFAVEAGGGWVGEQGVKSLTTQTDSAGFASVVWETVANVENVLRIKADSTADRVMTFNSGGNRPR